jgi:hypothetical protein
VPVLPDIPNDVISVGGLVPLVTLNVALICDAIAPITAVTWIEYIVLAVIPLVLLNVAVGTLPVALTLVGVTVVPFSLKMYEVAPTIGDQVIVIELDNTEVVVKANWAVVTYPELFGGAE